MTGVPLLSNYNDLNLQTSLSAHTDGKGVSGVVTNLYEPGFQPHLARTPLSANSGLMRYRRASLAHRVGATPILVSKSVFAKDQCRGRRDRDAPPRS